VWPTYRQFRENAGCVSIVGRGIRHVHFVAGGMRYRAAIASAAVRFVVPGGIAARRNGMV